MVHSYLVGKGGSEMKHFQKNYKVKMYIPREFSANQNVVVVSERNDEDHAVPSVMKLIEKLTDENVDEMILETDVDDTQCSEQIVDVPVPQSQKESWKLPQHSTRTNPRTSRYTDRQHVRTTHKSSGEDRQRFSISSSKLRTHRMRRLSQDTIQQ